MLTIACNECGHEIAEDDFVLQQCPICDGYMETNRLNIKVNPDLGSIVRIEPVVDLTLVEGV